MTPRLTIADWTAPSSWTWQLRDEAGVPIAQQRVSVEEGDPTFALATNLYRNRWRMDSEPGQPFLTRMGEFVGARLLGDVGRALAARSPVTVQVDLPASMTALLAVPFELAPLPGVTFCYRPAAMAPPAESSGTARVLAVFALPGESSALALSRERRELEAQFAGYGDGVELRTLQYGVTRAVFREALDDPAGWDVVHIAGHGRAGQLFLEREDDQRDLLTAVELVDLLAGASRLPGLVVLSACESGAVRTLRRRASRGDRTGQSPRPAEQEFAEGTGNLGYQVSARLACAVVAMRYPVDDDFSVALARHLYDRLLIDERPIDQALRDAVPVAAVGTAPLSVATPMLFGDPAFRLRLRQPVTDHSPALTAADIRPPTRFVGRTAVMARLLRGNDRVVLLTGMPGVGKTACLAEAAGWHRRRGRTVVWHDVRPDETPDGLISALGASARDPQAVIVLDNVDTAPQLADTLERLPQSTLLMAAGRVIRGLESAALVVPLLTSTESELLAREVQEQRTIDAGEPNDDTFRGSPWLIGRGHPALIEGRYTGRDEAIAWEVFAPIPVDRPVLPADHPGTAIASWAGAVAAGLTPGARLLWQFLSCLETADRREPLVPTLWPLVCAERRISPAPPAGAYDELVGRGLAQRWDRDRYLLHPAVARAGRDSDGDVESLTVALLAALWENRYEQGMTGGQPEDALAHAAASAAPYLTRLRRWEHASTRCEEAINHDRSPSMAARLIPLVNELVRVQTDPRRRRASQYVRAIVLLELDRERGIEELEAVYADAARDADQHTQVAAASSMASALLDRDPVRAAAWLDRASSAYDGDLSAVPIIRLKYAKIALELGDNAGALSYAQTVTTDLDRRLEAGTPRFNINAVRLEALAIAAAAAANLRDPATATRLRDDIDQEIARHGAGDRARAVAQFNRLTTDDGLLIAARGEFSNPADQRDFAAVTMRLARLDRDRRNDHEAVELARQALQSAYAAGDLWAAADTHEDLAEFLARLPQPPHDDIAVHLLASAVIGLRAAGLLLALSPPPQLMRALALLSFLLARRPGDLPESFDQLRQALSTMNGLDLDRLLHDTQRQPVLVDPHGGQPVLPSGDDEPGDSVTDALTWAGHWPPPAELADPETHPEHWQPIADLFTTPASSRDTQAAIDRLRTTGWSALADALEQPPGAIETDSGALDNAERAALTLILRRRHQ